MDTDSGDEAGTVKGVFEFWWRGPVLYGRNGAVGGHYVLGRSTDPGGADTASGDGRATQVLLWHGNYHPDGGQLLFPLDGKPLMAPLALPGDDVRPEHFVAFCCDGRSGLYSHPGFWHEGLFPLSPGLFGDRQGRVRARVSVDFAREFDCLLRVPLAAP